MKALKKRPEKKSSASTENKDKFPMDDYTSNKNSPYSDKFDQFELNFKSKLAGKPIPHDSALGHVTGEALFVDDITPVKNELIVDFISSPVAHGNIKSLNSKELAQQDGIAGVFTHEDIPGENLYGPVVQDEPILASDIVQYVGQPVAIIAGESHRAIREAKKKVRLNIKELKPVYTIDEAILAKQYIGEKRKFKQGDFERAWRESEHILKGTFVCSGQEQFYLESQAALARPGEHGDIHIHSSTQNPSAVSYTHLTLPTPPYV